MKRPPYKSSPCKDCPFRKDCLPEWLGAARMREILAAPSFICHKTSGRSQVKLQCAGHMIIRGDKNLFVSVADALNNKLVLTGQHLVFESEEACITHHSNMSDDIYWKIRKMMTAQGAWNRAQQMQVYTTEEFITAFGDVMSDELKALLRANVSRLQSYLDDRILEPITSKNEQT